MDFIAIDFETANEQRVSACAVGVCIVSGEHVETRSYLLRPPELRFSPFNIAIHGITPEMVRDAPTFRDVYPELREVLSAASIWAHSATFDQGVLNALAAQYRLSLPRGLECSCQLSRRFLPELPSHKLPDVCAHLGISLKHHDAASDAEACARIVLAAGGPGRAYSIPSAENPIHSKAKAIVQDGVVTLEEARSLLALIDADKVVKLGKGLSVQIDLNALRLKVLLEAILSDDEVTGAESESICRIVGELFCGQSGPSPSPLPPPKGAPAIQDSETFSFSGKVFCITGDFAFGDREVVTRMTERLGGVVKTGVSKKVDYLLVGGLLNPLGTKWSKAAELASAGHHIRVVPEQRWSLELAKVAASA